jgi:hypothetical protein
MIPFSCESRWSLDDAPGPKARDRAWERWGYENNPERVVIGRFSLQKGQHRKTMSKSEYTAIRIDNCHGLTDVFSESDSDMSESDWSRRGRRDGVLHHRYVGVTLRRCYVWALGSCSSQKLIPFVKTINNYKQHINTCKTTTYNTDNMIINTHINHITFDTDNRWTCNINIISMSNI